MKKIWKIYEKYEKIVKMKKCKKMINIKSNEKDILNNK